MTVQFFKLLTERRNINILGEINVIAQSAFLLYKGTLDRTLEIHTYTYSKRKHCTQLIAALLARDMSIH